MMVVSIFNLIEWFDNSEIFRQLKNSGVKCSKALLSLASDLSMESQLKYSFKSPTLKMNNA